MTKVLVGSVGSDSFRLAVSADGSTFFDGLSVDNATGIVDQPRPPRLKLHDAHDLWPAFLSHLTVEDRGGRGLRLSQTALAMDAALSGQGIALVSGFLATRDIAEGRLVRVHTDALSVGHDFYLLAERRSKRGSAAQATFDWFASKADADA